MNKILQYSIFILLFISVGIFVSGTTTITDNFINITNGTGYLNLNGQNQFTISNYSKVNDVMYATAGSASSIRTKLNLCPTTGCIVRVPKGNYNISSTITVPDNTQLIFEQGNNVSIGADVNAFVLGKRITFEGLRATTDLVSYSKSFIIINTSFSQDDRVFVRDVYIYNRGGVTGKGISIISNANGVRQAWGEMEAVEIKGFEDGLYLEASAPDGTAFINSWTFKNLMGSISKNFIHINNTGNNDIDGNYFDVRYQTESTSERSLICRSCTQNRFLFYTWDLTSKSATNISYEFDENSSNNLLEGTWSGGNHLIDNGTGNNFRSYDGDIVGNWIFDNVNVTLQAPSSTNTDSPFLKLFGDLSGSQLVTGVQMFARGGYSWGRHDFVIKQHNTDDYTSSYDAFWIYPNGTTIVNGSFSTTGGMSWSDLNNYPVACPTGSYLTQLNDSVTCTSINTEPASDYGLIFHAPFTEASSSVLDYSGQGINGTATAVSFSKDKIGVSAIFNLTDGMIFGDPSQLDFDNTTNFSISFWFKREATPFVAAEFLIAKNGDGGAGSYEIYLNNGILTVRESNVVVTTSPTAYNDSTWHHVVVSDNRQTSNNVKIYIDGNLVKTGTIANTNLTTTKAFYIGRRNPSGFFNGSMDDVRIYNRVLPANEVVSLFEQNGEEYSIQNSFKKNQDVIPTQNNLFSLGSSTLRWLKGWFVNIDVSGNANIMNATINSTGYFKILANTTSLTCAALTEGSIYYNNVTRVHYGCNSTNWNALY